MKAYKLKRVDQIKLFSDPASVAGVSQHPQYLFWSPCTLEAAEVAPEILPLHDICVLKTIVLIGASTSIQFSI